MDKKPIMMHIPTRNELLAFIQQFQQFNKVTKEYELVCDKQDLLNLFDVRVKSDLQGEIDKANAGLEELGK